MSAGVCSGNAAETPEAMVSSEGTSHPFRTDGGVAKGATIGILLDFSRGIMIFLINDEQQGPVAFEGLEGLYYPAISINRNVQVTALNR